MKRIRTDNRKRTGFLKKRSSESLMLFLKGDGDLSDILPDYVPLSKNEDVVKCANIIADLVSSMTIMLMKNGEKGDTRLKNELSKKIDISPCRYMDRKNFIFKIARDMLLHGNSVVYPEVDGMYIKDLQPLEQDGCSYKKTDSRYAIIYKGQVLNPDDVLHFVYIPDEKEPFKGIGQKDAIIDAAKMLTQASTTKKKFLQSKWKPSMIISINADAEELMDPKLRKEVLGSYVSDTEEGEPWVIPAGEIDVKTIQPLSLSDLAIQDSIKMDKQAVAAAFNMPAFMVGIGEFNQNAYNNFISTTVMSIAMIIQQQLTSKLLFSGDLYFKMNYKSLLQYSLEDTITLIKGMVGGGMMSRNEGRCELDYTPVDQPGMDEFIVLENYIPVDKVGDQKKLNQEEKQDG
ncbi:MAG: phage portal protein [Lachnospiraceae bacterium]|nr:phage portal protein [Lachnospiraceae bacterium]